MPDKVFIYSPELESGGYPPGCPFNTGRAGQTRATVDSMGLLDGADRREVPPVRLDRAALEGFHTRAYLDALQRGSEGKLAPDEALHFGLGTPDCPLFPGMYDYPALAAGGTTTGARLIVDEEAHIAFNPSGGFHHAMPGNAAGFCYLNDVVLGILRLTDAGRRVAFLDIDVHHGDGVQNAFYARSDVLTVSLHESGRTLFPGTGFEDEVGIGEGRGYCVNVPLPVGTHDAAYRKAFREAVLPVLRAYDPDVVVLEIGMDGLAGDPLAHLNLTNNLHADVIEDVRALGTPLLATGGGGYNVPNTVRGWALAWSVLCGDQAHHDDLMIGMGGVMLETTDWQGGLRDRVLLSDAGKRVQVTAEVDDVIARVQTLVFPLHGIDDQSR